MPANTLTEKARSWQVFLNTGPSTPPLVLSQIPLTPRRLPMSSEDRIVHLDDEMAEFVAELEDARAAKKKAEEREKAARDVLLQALHEAQANQGLTASGRGVAVQVQVRTGVNRKQLEAMYPEVFEACRTETEVEVLKLV